MSRRRVRLTHDIADGLVEAWQGFPVQETTSGVLVGALAIKTAHGFSCDHCRSTRTGVRRNPQEDMSRGREVEGLRIVDPFR